MLSYEQLIWCHGKELREILQSSLWKVLTYNDTEEMLLTVPARSPGMRLRWLTDQLRLAWLKTRERPSKCPPKSGTQINLITTESHKPCSHCNQSSGPHDWTINSHWLLLTLPLVSQDRSLFPENLSQRMAQGPVTQPSPPALRKKEQSHHSLYMGSLLGEE